MKRCAPTAPFEPPFSSGATCATSGSCRGGIRSLGKLVGTAALIALLAACSKNIQNQEAVRSAVVEYLTARASQTGLDMNAMTVEVAAMTFERDTARVTVSISPKGANGGGMQMRYDLDRKGDKWVVRPGANPHGMTPGSSTPSGQALPPGHPAVGQQ